MGKEPNRIYALIVGTVVLLYGLMLAISGAWLVSKGGTFYYLAAGLGTLATGWLVARRRRLGLLIYAGVAALSLVWGLWEAGTALWLILPRLAAPMIAGLFAWSPWWFARRSSPVQTTGTARTASLIAGGIAGTAGLTFLAMHGLAAHADDAPPAPAAGATASDASQWLHYGNDLGASRFSPTNQITPANVAELEVAWTFRTGDLRNAKPGNLPALETTPLKVGSTLYACTPESTVIAIDAATGKERWRHDPKPDMTGLGTITCRGVSYYAAPAASECQQRIIAPVIDGKLVALDAQTGAVCRSFGTNGTVDLRQDLGEVLPGYYSLTSPPTIVRGTVVVGGAIKDNASTDEPSGVIRGYDAVTGALRWAWDPALAPGSAPTAPGVVHTRGAPNAWGVASGDEALGLAYIGMGNATPDFFGGLKDDNKARYASSIVALDVATGRPRWSFQTVHRDIWDYDVAAQASLVDLDTPKGKVPALIQGTKSGQLFMLDRRTGKPIAQVEERPTPRGAVPGEILAPTQPFSTGLPSLVPPDLTEASMWGLTPFDQMWCRARFLDLRYDGMFTPPSIQGTIFYPSSVGGVNWGGTSVDPERQLLMVNVNRIAQIWTLIPHSEKDKALAEAAAGGKARKQPMQEQGYYQEQKGTPYGVALEMFLSPLGVPCTPPPWGVMEAFDLKTRTKLWSKPLGGTRDQSPLPIDAPLGTPNFGGSLVTRSGLTFIGAAAENRVRAFDSRTGALKWTADVPAGPQATPMTYVENGRQYVVFAAGGSAMLGTQSGDYLIAYALPGKR